MENLFHKWQRVFQVCRNHHPGPLIIHDLWWSRLFQKRILCTNCDFYVLKKNYYHRDGNKSNTTGTTNGTGNNYTSVVLEFILGCGGVRVSLSFMCSDWWVIVLLLFILVWPLCCLFFFDLRLLITALVFANISWNNDNLLKC